MATPGEVRRDVGEWLSDQLGHTVECEEVLDPEELKFRVSGTRPAQIIMIPRVVSDRETTEDLIAALEHGQVIGTLKSGEHCKGKLTQHGLRWSDD